MGVSARTYLLSYDFGLNRLVVSNSLSSDYDEIVGMQEKRFGISSAVRRDFHTAIVKRNAPWCEPRDVHLYHRIDVKNFFIIVTDW